MSPEKGKIMIKRKTKKDTVRCPKCNCVVYRNYERFKESKIKWFECKNCGESFGLPILKIYPDAGIMEIQE